jgi:hypothetical protein
MTDQTTPRPAGLDALLGYVADNLPEPTAPAPLTPEAVNAIVRDPDDPRYPCQITVFCDHCGLKNTGDYMVSDDMTKPERLAAARAHLVANEGWEHTTDGDDFCPEHASVDAAQQAAPALPYTDADLRHEAIAQHRDLTDDPEYFTVGEAMCDAKVLSSATGETWETLLDEDGYSAAQSKIHDLVSGADVSDWAVNLGADGLTPDSHHADFGRHPGAPAPLMRLHFAFHPEADETDRHALAALVTEAVQDALNHALDT